MGVDNDSSKVYVVLLGAMGVYTGTRGTIYFDDFELAPVLLYWHSGRPRHP